MWKPASDTQTVDTAANTVTTTRRALLDLRDLQRPQLGREADRPRRDAASRETTAAEAAMSCTSTSHSCSTARARCPRTTRTASVAPRRSDSSTRCCAQDRGAVVDFDFVAVLLQGLTGDKALLKAAIDRIDSSGGTDIGAGVQVGLDALGATVDPTRAKIMILLTDGEGSWNPALIPVARIAPGDDLHDRPRLVDRRDAASVDRDRHGRAVLPCRRRPRTSPTCSARSARTPATTARTPTATA